MLTCLSLCCAPWKLALERIMSQLHFFFRAFFEFGIILFISLLNGLRPNFKLSLTSWAEVKSYSKLTHFYFERKMSSIRAFLKWATELAQRAFYLALRGGAHDSGRRVERVFLYEKGESESWRCRKEKWDARFVAGTLVLWEPKRRDVRTEALSNSL